MRSAVQLSAEVKRLIDELESRAKANGSAID